MKTVIIVQARMTSTRLPGKVLKEVLGKPLLAYQLERLKRIKNVDEIIIATTINDTDQPIVDLAQRLRISVYRGSEEDVLARFYEAAQIVQADIVVRVTADCPLFDPRICENAIEIFMQHYSDIDYLRLEHYPRGLDVEVFSFKVLAECFKEATTKHDREHVTPYLYRNPERYRVQRLYCPQDYSHFRWTVDTEEDFMLIKKIIEAIYIVKQEFDFADILNLIDTYPEWQLINAAVQQKQYGE